jgi:ribosomal protein L11 methyltransferase
MRSYPALDVRGADPDLVLAAVDDFAPSAVEDLADGVSIFFAAPGPRDEARQALERSFPTAMVSSRDVDDGDWARRSQQSLTPITVGRITVTPPWSADGQSNVASVHPPSGSVAIDSASAPISIVITPSMGFGTGHHATTRLCLAALQALEVAGKRVLDVGTGSGVLAIAAARLGALDVLGIDVDPDAIASARENLEANPEASHVRLEVVEMRDAALPQSDIVVANLTGAVLVLNAARLTSAVARRGALVVSGVQAHERGEVAAAFSEAEVTWSAEEAGWVSLGFNFPASPTV